MEVNLKTLVFAVIALVSAAATPARPAAADTTPQLAGSWTMSMDTPHGAVKGSLQLTQDGSKLTGKYEAPHFGTMTITGTLDGTKVSFNLEVQMAGTFKLSGTASGDKMSGTSEFGSWSASRQ